MKFLSIPLHNLSTHQQLVASLYGNELLPALIVNKHTVKHYGVYEQNQLQCFGTIFSTNKNNVFTLGNFQCVNNTTIASFFFQMLKERLLQQGVKQIIGPMHGSTWFPYRFSEQLTQPFTTEFTHKSYYPNLWLANNFTSEQTYFSNIAPVDTSLQNMFRSTYFKENDFSVKQLTEDTNKETLYDIYQFVQEQFSQNYFYTELSFDDFLPIGKQYIQLFKGNFSQLVYKEDTLVGLLLACEDATTPKRAIVRTIARKREKAYQNIPHEMCKLFYLQLIKQGFETQIHAYFNEKNPSRKISEQFGGKPYRKHTLYSTFLSL